MISQKLKINRILLLDDESSVVLALRLLLEALGFAPQDFTDPLEALSYLESTKNIDLFLCDLRMPKMNGLDVLAKAKKSRPDVPFVLMSAHAGPEEIEKAQILGAFGFLSKPFAPEDLRTLMSQIEAAIN